MSDLASEPLHDELRRHASALRTLARDLLRDPHAADDVTQATLQQALRRQGDLRPGPLGGWLTRTLVNFVHQWRRGERRRAAREASLPVRAPAPGAAEQLARAEMLRSVTNAVLALDEPYQTTVFLRYFEDLPPRQIARRTATNVATVKSRLARGLAQLRVRLDATARGGERWRPALAFAFGLPLGASLVPLATGTLLVSSTTKILFAAAVVVAGGLFAYGLGDDPAPATGTVAEAPDATAAAQATSPPPTEDAATQRHAPAAATTPTAAWLEHPFQQALEVLVVDEFGLPIEGHKLELAPAGCAWNVADQATGPDGRVRLTWRTRQERCELELREPRGTLRKVALRSGAPVALTLLGRAPAPQRTYLAVKKTARARELLVSEGERTVRTFLDSKGSSETPTMHAGLHPHAVFGDRSASAQRAAKHELLASSLVTEGRFELAWAESVVRSKVNTRLKADFTKGEATVTTGIAGIVFDATGAPAKAAPVYLLGSGPQPLQRSATGDDGRYRFDAVPPGNYTVRAGGDAAGLATLPVAVTQGTTPATLHLRSERCVRGRLRDAAGKAIADASVEWRSLDGSWCDAAKTGADGAFVLANLPGGAGSVSAFVKDAPHRLPGATADAVLPDTGELLLTVAAGGGSLRFEPIAAAAESLPDAVRVWHVESGLGTTLRPPEKGAIWSLKALPAGTYTLDLQTVRSGRVLCERIWIDGKLAADAGRIEMPRAGSLRLDIATELLPPAGEQRAFELSSLRPVLDVHLEPADLPLGQPIELPAGDYVLAFRHADGGVRFVRFAVKADAETIVRGDG